MKRRSGFGWVEFISGLCMLALGIFSFIRPSGMLTGLAVVYGIIAVITGVCDILVYIRAERFTGFAPALSLVSGILSVMAGMVLVAHPGIGAGVLTVLFPLWFICHCISRLMHLDIVRFCMGKGCFYFSLVVNILGLVLGIMMLFEPVFTLVAAGTLIGVYLIGAGVESVVLAFSGMEKRW